ncbi:hypothetical protein WJX79_010384 [Trebouxia sp. C0005]
MYRRCCAKTCALLLCPLVVLLLLIYLVLAYLVSVLLTLLYLPRLLAVQKLYWCCPFIPRIWEAQRYFKGQCMRVGFESTYTVNVLRRILTLPIRPHLPDFYIVGFPKAGTTSLANHLKQHPALSGLDGLPWHESLSKESHFFNGVLGRSHASSALLYRSFFPTILCRWWAEYIRGVEKWMCFDACPVTACLPYTARRMKAITPDAKLIFMMRDPVPVMFSAETMLVNMGVPLTWSLVDPMTTHDLQFQETEEEAQLWKDLKDLQPSDPIPHNMPELFYTHLHSLLKCGQYADRIHPFLQEFPRANMMFIDFNEFTKNTEGVVKEVCSFVGADPALYKHKELPPGMKTEYQGRRMHPSVKQHLTTYFKQSNNMLYSMLHRNFHWTDVEQ